MVHLKEVILAQHYENFVTHSEFLPYITTIGLYNDSGECLVIGKLSKPIKNNDKLGVLWLDLMFNFQRLYLLL